MFPLKRSVNTSAFDSVLREDSGKRKNQENGKLWVEADP